MSLSKKLARVLLADPLADEGAWEKELEEVSPNDCGAILLRYGIFCNMALHNYLRWLRYGEDGDEAPHNPLLKTILVPSRVLRNNKLEILVSNINVNANGPGRSSALDRPQDAILVPALQTPTSFSGRHTIVTYPVHKAIVAGEGLGSILSYGRFAAREPKALPERTVKVAIGISASGVDTKDSSPSNTLSLVDVDLATQALASFRESIANAMIYERGWSKSGMPALSDWLIEGTSSESNLKPMVKDLIVSVVDEANDTITAEESSSRTEGRSSRISETTKSSILSSLSVWAEHAHRELRDQLDVAFAGKHWAKIKWWKLFWRVDDVAMVSSEVLERRWLRDAEKGIIFIAGRVEEAGYFRNVRDLRERQSLQSPEAERAQILGQLPEYITVEDVARADLIRKADGTVPEFKLTPWPAHIPLTRLRLLQETVPPLQALAQSLVLQTLSTSFLTSALSALMYLSITTTSFFEAGAVAALGTTWSLRRMQRKWEAAREFWEAEVREEGRRALKQTEESVGAIISDGDKQPVDSQSVDERTKAKRALARVRELLEILEQKKAR